jgi:Flp pilus assembly protein TadG
MILENGMKNVARLVRTGQAQNQALTAEQFRQQLCNQVQLVLSCDVAKLYIDVRAFNSFAGSGFPPPVDAQGNLIPGNVSTYQPGASSQLSTQNSIVLVRAFYTWQMFTPLLGQYYANMPNNIRLLTASAAFRNEPF